MPLILLNKGGGSPKVGEPKEILGTYWNACMRPFTVIFLKRLQQQSTQVGCEQGKEGRNGTDISIHLPKHFRIEDVILEERNLRPVDPPGK